MGTGGQGFGEPPAGGSLAGVLRGRPAVLGLLALSIVLAIALVVSLTAWRRERGDLQDRIAELSQRNSQSQALWKAQLSACHAATSPQRVMQTGGGAPGDEAAQRLLAQGPEGIDGCARMESADQAVLATLK